MSALSVFRSTSEITQGLAELLREAEGFGKVEIGYVSFGSDREVKIDMGKYGNMSARVWGKGPTAEIALMKAIEKARSIEQWFPHPDRC